MASRWQVVSSTLGAQIIHMRLGRLQNSEACMLIGGGDSHDGTQSNTILGS